MRGYTYVPNNYEAMLAFQVNEYISNNPDEYTIITPYYKSNMPFVSGINLVVSKLINGQIIEHPNSIQYTNFLGEEITKTIVGFTIEGDIEQELPTEVYEQLMSSEGVVFYATNTEYLQFLSTL